MPILGLNQERAYQNSMAPASTGVPNTLPQQAAAAYQATLAADLVQSEHAEMDHEYDLLVAEWEEATGKRLERRASQTSEGLSQIHRNGTMLDVTSMAQFDYESILDQIRTAKAGEDAALAGSFPSTHEEMIARRNHRVQLLVGEREAGLARGSSLLGDIAGMTAGFFSDPVLLSTMFIGAPATTGGLAAAVTGTAAKALSIRSGVAIEAAAGTISEAVLQSAVQPARARMGLEYGLDKALQSIATVGLASGAFYGVLRGLGKGMGVIHDATRERAIRRKRDAMPEDQRAAFDQLVALYDAFQRTPLRAATPGETRDHLAVIDEAAVAIEEGRLVKFPGIRAGDLDARIMSVTEARAALMPALKTIGFDVDLLLPGLSRSISMVSETVQIGVSAARIRDFKTALEALDPSGDDAKALRAALGAEEHYQALRRTYADELDRYERSRSVMERKPSALTRDDADTLAELLDTPAWRDKLYVSRLKKTPDDEVADILAKARAAVKRKTGDPPDPTPHKAAQARREQADAALAARSPRTAESASRLIRQFSDEELNKMQTMRDVGQPTDPTIPPIPRATDEAASSADEASRLVEETLSSEEFADDVLSDGLGELGDDIDMNADEATLRAAFRKKFPGADDEMIDGFLEDIRMVRDEQEMLAEAEVCATAVAAEAAKQGG